MSGINQATYVILLNPMWHPPPSPLGAFFWPNNDHCTTPSAKFSRVSGGLRKQAVWRNRRVSDGTEGQIGQVVHMQRLPILHHTPT